MKHPGGTKYQMTNRRFAEQNVLFVKACELAGVPATKRQASKWRNREGQAYLKRHAALAQMRNAQREAAVAK